MQRLARQRRGIDDPTERAFVTQPSTTSKLPKAPAPPWHQIWKEDWEGRGGDTALEAKRLDLYQAAIDRLRESGLPGVGASPSDADAIEHFANEHFTRRILHHASEPTDTPYMRARRGLAMQTAVEHVQSGRIPIDGDPEKTATAIERFVVKNLANDLTAN